MFLKRLRVFYNTPDHEEAINSDFDKEVRDLAKKYGLKFLGSGVEIPTLERDLSFIEDQPNIPEKGGKK